MTTQADDPIQTAIEQWPQRLVIAGTRGDLGLAGYPLVTLSEARQRAFDNRRLARAGGDPLALKHRPDVPAFADAAETVIGIHAAGWKDSGKSVNQWRASLRDYALPRLGRCRVSDITTADVMAVLLPIWSDKHETARRVRQCIGAVMKWAVAEGHRHDNPAGDAIGAALPNNGVVRQHQRALPHAKVGAALAKMRQFGAYRSTVLAFEYLVLTVSGAAKCAAPSGMKSTSTPQLWTVPAERMKAPREVCELALAHVNSDRVEAAYRRSDLFERRRELMQNWATYIAEGGRHG